MTVPTTIPAGPYLGRPFEEVVQYDRAAIERFWMTYHLVKPSWGLAAIRALELPVTRRRVDPAAAEGAR